MLGVVENLAAVFFQEGHRIGDHGEVFIGRHIQDLRDMEQPGLADNRHHRRPRLEKHAHLRIGLGRDSSAARAAEGGDLRVFPLQLRRLRKKRRIARIRARPAALDEINPERIEPLGHTNLVGHGKRNPRPLRAITQRRIVNRDLFHLRRRP